MGEWGIAKAQKRPNPQQSVRLPMRMERETEKKMGANPFSTWAHLWVHLSGPC